MRRFLISTTEFFVMISLFMTCLKIKSKISMNWLICVRHFFCIKFFSYCLQLTQVIEHMFSNIWKTWSKLNLTNAFTLLTNYSNCFVFDEILVVRRFQKESFRIVPYSDCSLNLSKIVEKYLRRSTVFSSITKSELQ